MARHRRRRGGRRALAGVWPGMRVRSFPMTPETMSCSTSADDGSGGARGRIHDQHELRQLKSCFAEYQPLSTTLPPAPPDAGNDFRAREPASIDRAAFPTSSWKRRAGRGTRRVLSSASDATDLAAPGRERHGRPPQFDEDGTPDGWQALSGTSFPPMVSPRRRGCAPGGRRSPPSEVSAVLCSGARDVGRAGWYARNGCGASTWRVRLHAAAAAAGCRRAQRRRCLGDGMDRSPLWVGVAERHGRSRPPSPRMTTRWTSTACSGRRESCSELTARREPAPQSSIGRRWTSTIAMPPRQSDAADARHRGAAASPVRARPTSR